MRRSAARASCSTRLPSRRGPARRPGWEDGRGTAALRRRGDPHGHDHDHGRIRAHRHEHPPPPPRGRARAAAARRGRAADAARAGGDLGHRRHDRRRRVHGGVPRIRPRGAPRRARGRAAVGGDPGRQQRRRARGARGGRAGGGAADPRGQLHPRGRLPARDRGRARGRARSSARHLLRPEQGAARGARQPVRRPARARRGERPDHDGRARAVAGPERLDLALAGRRGAARGGRAAVGRARPPHRVGRLAEHPALGVARRGRGDRLPPGGRRRGVRAPLPGAREDTSPPAGVLLGSIFTEVELGSDMG
ncbi:hypothetical protein CMMCAS02_02035 [Clavibacter michiganensis subsp. michiganensis]|nr:hypothetical protein CMMCAS02_02035 [Clavibacter michiganensis subsp. michiganensis]